jgi:predicted dehydrogenase
MRGAHVLIEKPFVLTPGDGAILQEVAAAHDRIIAVNQTRRFFPLAPELRQRVRTGEFGEFKSAVHFEGVKLSWPFESGAAFAPRAYRTGVIMDFGVHVIDFYHYLLTPNWNVTSAIHDGFNGPEGLAELQITASGAPITIRLSRYFQQRNVAQLSFERAEVWADVYSTDTYWVKARGGSARAFRSNPSGLRYEELADAVVSNFFAAGEGAEPPVCDGASSLPVIALLDKIYSLALRYPAQIGLV